MDDPTPHFSLVPSTSFLIATYPPGATFGPRRLRDFEFVWMLEGNAVYTWNDTVLQANEGAMLLCRPDAIDAFRWDPQNRTRHAYFHFTITGTLPEAWPPVTDWPLVRHPQREDDLLYSLFRHLLAWNDIGDATQMRLLAQSLLAAFVTGQTEANAVRPPHLPDPVMRAHACIIRTLDGDPAARISLADLAKAACVSPEYLCRLFSRTTGHSPAEAVRIARLERAVTLLTRTNFNITEVAHMAGFDSPFHFSRVVKAQYGLSPRELRRATAEGRFVPMTPLIKTSQ